MVALFFFFFLKNRKISSFTSDQMFFFLFSYLFCDMCATIFNGIFIHSRKTMDFELFL